MKKYEILFENEFDTEVLNEFRFTRIRRVPGASKRSFKQRFLNSFQRKQKELAKGVQNG